MGKNDGLPALFECNDLVIEELALRDCISGMCNEPIDYYVSVDCLSPVVQCEKMPPYFGQPIPDEGRTLRHSFARCGEFN